jgi:hypothetical protein
MQRKASHITRCITELFIEITGLQGLQGEYFAALLRTYGDTVCDGLSSLLPAGFPPVPQYPFHTANVITPHRTVLALFTHTVPQQHTSQ